MAETGGVAGAGGARMTGINLASRPSLVEAGKLRFLIFDTPKEETLPQYLLECKKHNVTHLVRVCECMYSSEQVLSAGIAMHEMAYADGSHPPDEIIRQWLDVVDSAFSAEALRQGSPCIAVHCVAGLGRAPVLVAIALIEDGMEAISAVTLIREQRRGAINTLQLGYLKEYRPTRNGDSCAPCVIL